MPNHVAKCRHGHVWAEVDGWAECCPTCGWAAESRNELVREPMTCRVCWEEAADNVKLVLASQAYNNRSVETLSRYVCPVCGHDTGVLPT